MIAYDRLSLIIPADQALANKALQAALQQITGISFSNLPDLSIAVKQLNTTFGLPLVSAQTQVLPTAVYQYYINTFAANLGTGPNGSITIADVLGAIAGIPYTEEFGIIESEVNTLINNGQLVTLTSIYQTMLDTVDGVYGSGPITIPSGPAAGSYADFETAFAGNSPSPGIGLIPAAQNEIDNVVSANPTLAAALNAASDIVAASLVRENTNQTNADINWNDLIANSKVSLMSFVLSIGAYSQDTAQGGATQMIENMANVTSYGGQALVAALREGTNVVALGNANIETATQVSADPNPPAAPAELSDSTFTETEAQSQLIF